MDLLTAMQEKLVALLTPLVGVLEDLDVQELRVEAFNGTADLEELVERFRPLMPCALLNIPRVTYDTAPSLLRICDATLEYGLMVATNDRRDELTRQAFARDMHDKFLRQTLLVQLDKTGVPCTRLEFLRPQSWEYTVVTDQEESVVMSVFLFTFHAEVKNWQLNTPA